MDMPFKFKGAQQASQSVVELTKEKEVEVKNPLDQTFNTYYSVCEPFVIQDAIPRDLRNRKLNTSTKSAFDVFETFDEAAIYAQKQNRPLVIMEIKAVSKVRPQLPLVEKI